MIENDVSIDKLGHNKTYFLLWVAVKILKNIVLGGHLFGLIYFIVYSFFHLSFHFYHLEHKHKRTALT